MPTALVQPGMRVPVDGGRLRGRRDDLRVVSAADEAEVRERLPGADVFITSNASWDDAYLDGLDANDWVQTIGAGYDRYPIDAFRERGVLFTNAPGIHGASAGEHVFGFALSFSRRLPEYRDRQRDHEWDPVLATDWAGRTMTVLGLGTIGEAVAERALAFEMTVWGVKRDPGTYDGCVPAERVLPAERMAEPLSETDLLVVVLPRTDETRGLVDATALEALPESAILVNIGRGEVVDEAALIDALRAGGIAGAGLDVFEEEPLPSDSPLWDMDDVLITPHVAGVSDRYSERFAGVFLDHYDRWRAGEDPAHRVV